MDPVPIWCTGELYLGGSGVSRGYVGQPDLTAERFVPSPLSPSRLYRTGDLARFLPDGSIEFIGRVDGQVKVHGFRVEIGEIERAILADPEIREAAVVARPAAGSGCALHAYFTAHGNSVDATAVRERLTALLPSYMIPAAVMRLDVMPVTPNGKLDRQALPDLRCTRPESGRPPASDVEWKLAALFGEVLELESVGVDDRFLEIGGHSLKAMRLLARVHRDFGVEVGLREFFEEPTVAGLARRLEGTSSARSSIISRSSERPVLSFAQERIWFLQQWQPDSAAYNVFAAFVLNGRLDLEALHRALSAIVRRHQTLRTTFTAIDGQPLPAVHDVPGTMVTVVDLSALGPEDRTGALVCRTRDEVRRPFNLAAEIPFRALLLVLGPEAHHLVVVMHHIVADGWSLGVFYREMAALYASERAGVTAELAPPAIQYSDFAAWQRRSLDALMGVQAEYWIPRLTGAVPLDLPADRLRPSAMDFEGGRHAIAIPPADSSAIKAFSRGNGATPFMVLLAAFKALLYRYTDQSDVVVGSPVANRNRVEVENLIGFFSNTLVLRSQVHAEETFDSLVAQVRETTLGAYDHQDLPFERLVELLHIERDPSRTPIFQIMFVLQNAPMAPLAMSDLEVTPVDVDSRTSKFDLAFVLLDRHDGFNGFFEYRTSLFDSATIERLASHFTTLLYAAIESPGMRIGRLPLLSEAEREQILVAWNQTATTYPRDAGIPEIVEKLVAEAPDAPAVRRGDEVRTYRSLDRRSNQMARRLLECGAGPGTNVALLLERSIELVEWTLAILKTGAAYVPLDSASPASRLNLMLTDAECPVLVTEPGLLDRAAGFSGSVLNIADEERRISQLADLPIGASVGANDPAYVIYTSGSTGVPKGVVVPHRAIVRLVRNTNYVDIAPGDVWAQVSNPSFDAITLEIWGALLNGASMAVIERPTTLSPDDFAAAIRRYGISKMVLATALFHQIADQRPDAFAPLDHLLVGGEAMDVRRARAVLEAGPPKRFTNGYGPTESVTFAVCHSFDRVPERAGSIPIGRVISNTTAYVLDRRLQAVPAGIPGELFLAGDGLAIGYLRQTALTSEKFIPNPFGSGRLYRTGDRVRWLADGTIDYLGRIDNQVKIRGFRVELGEIEEVLRRHPDVDDAVAVVLNDAPGGSRRIAAYVAARPDALMVAIRVFIRQSLPDYMMPSALVRMDRLPVNANGKIDRSALPAPGAGTAEESAEFKPPLRAAEVQIASVWCDLLKTERVGLDDNFFDIGGHSLLMMQAHARLADTFSKPITIVDLFRYPTVRSLAQFLETETPKATTATSRGRERAARQQQAFKRPPRGEKIRQ